MERKKLGLIINPVAGLGGSVGLKGSDGMVEEALARGAVPQSECRARVALQELLHDRDHLIVYTGTGNMGANLARELGFECVVMESGRTDATTAEDTKVLSYWLQEQGMDLILFTGGDSHRRTGLPFRARQSTADAAGAAPHRQGKYHHSCYQRKNHAAARSAFAGGHR